MLKYPFSHSGVGIVKTDLDMYSKFQFFHHFSEYFRKIYQPMKNNRYMYTRQFDKDVPTAIERSIRNERCLKNARDLTKIPVLK